MRAPCIRVRGAQKKERERDRENSPIRPLRPVCVATLIVAALYARVTIDSRTDIFMGGTMGRARKVYTREILKKYVGDIAGKKKDEQG